MYFIVFKIKWIYAMAYFLLANPQEKFQHVLLSKISSRSLTFCNLLGHPDPKVVQKKYAATKAEGRLIVHQNGNLKTNDSQEKEIRENKCTPLILNENISQGVIDFSMDYLINILFYAYSFNIA